MPFIAEEETGRPADSSGPLLRDLLSLSLSFSSFCEGGRRRELETGIIVCGSSNVIVVEGRGHGMLAQKL